VPTALKSALRLLAFGTFSSTDYSVSGSVLAMSWVSIPGQVPHNWSTGLGSFSGAINNPYTLSLGSFGQSNLA
jgi:hypothetical protein